MVQAAADGPPPLPVTAEHHRSKLAAADWPVEAAALRERLAWFAPDDAVRMARVAAAIAGLGSKSYAEREHATANLHTMGPGVRAALAAAAASPDPEVRTRVAALLARAERAEPTAIEATLYLAYDPDPRSRDTVVGMVAHGPAVLRRMATAVPVVATAAGSPPDRSWLRALLAHPQPAVRAAAVSALGRLPDPTDDDLRTIDSLMADPQPDVRLAAASAAAPRHATSAATVLLSFFADADHERAARAAEAFGRLADMSLSYSHLPSEARDGTWARRFAQAISGDPHDPPALMCRWETTLVFQDLPCTGAAFDSSGAWVATAHRVPALHDRIELLQVWHLARGTVVLERTPGIGEKIPRSMALSAGARQLYFGTDDGSIGALSPWRMWLDPRSRGGYRTLANNHAVGVVAIRVNDDDSALLALDEDGNLKLWRTDASTNFRPTPLAPGCAPLPGAGLVARWWAIAFDGRSRPIGVRYHPRGWLDVVDVESGESRLALEADLGERPAVALARDASRVAWVMRDGTVLAWDLNTGRRSIVPTPLTAKTLALPVASSHVVVGGGAGQFEVWDASARTQRARWVLPRHFPEWLDLDPTGTRLIATSSSGTPRLLPARYDTVAVIDAATGDNVGAYPSPHRGNAHRVGWIAGGRRLATADPSGRVAIWDVDLGARTVTLARTFSPPSEARPKDSANPWLIGPVERADGRIAVGTHQWVHTYDPSGRKADASIAASSGGMRCVPVALPDGDFAIAWNGTVMGRLSLADARWVELPEQPEGRGGPYSSDGRLRFSRNAAHEWIVRDLRDESGKTRVAVPGVNLSYGPLDGSPIHAWAPDARALVLSRIENSRQGHALVWFDMRTGQVAERLEPTTPLPTAICTSGDGRLTVTAHKEGLTIYRAGAPPADIARPGLDATMLVLHPDGRAVVARTASGEFQLWAIAER